MVAGDALKDFEPLYGETYLPRKVCPKVVSFALQYLI
jgi:hypothetical protein